MSLLVEKLAGVCRSSPTGSVSTPTIVVQELTSKFRELKEGDDVVDYMAGFEDQQACSKQF